MLRILISILLCSHFLTTSFSQAKKESRAISALKTLDSLSNDEYTFEGKLARISELINISLYNSKSDSSILSSNIAHACYLLRIGEFEKSINKIDSLIVVFKDKGHTPVTQIESTLYYLASSGIGVKQEIQFLIKMIELWDVTQNQAMSAYTYQKIGYLFRNQRLYRKAIEYFDKSRSIAKRNNRPYIEQWSTHYIGSTYRRMGNADSALVWNKRSLDLALNLENCRVIGTPLNELGKVYYSLGEYRIALEYHLQSLKEKQKVNEVDWGLSWASVEIARDYLALDILDSAKHYASLTEQYCASTGYFTKENEKLKYVQYLISEKEGKEVEALNYYKEFHLIQDSLNNSENAQDLTQNLADFEFEKEKKLLAEIQKNKDELNRQERKQQEQRTFYLILVLLITFSFGVFLFFRFKKEKQQKITISDQKLRLEEAHNEVQDSINYAKRIQSAILPPPKLVKQYLEESFIFYRPKDIVAGDFYWMETTQRNGKDIVMYAAADCTGHGVPGAMVSVVCSNAMNRAIKEFEINDPGKLLDKVVELVTESFEKSEDLVKDGMDIALCAIDIESRTLWYAGAHNPLYRVTNSTTATSEDAKIIEEGERKLVEYKADKQPVGAFEHMKAFTTTEIKLEEGDVIYTSSDGFPDQFGGEKGKKYKYGAFKKFLLSIENEPIDQQKDLLNAEFERWKGDLEQVDDVCIIGMRV